MHEYECFGSTACVTAGVQERHILRRPDERGRAHTLAAGCLHFRETQLLLHEEGPGEALLILTKSRRTLCHLLGVWKCVCNHTRLHITVCVLVCTTILGHAVKISLLLQDEDNLREALRYSAALLGELRTSLLTPQPYYELYMQATGELQLLEVRC